MADSTTHIGITYLVKGQKEKEVTINDGFDKIDAKFYQTPRFLGDLTGDPATTNVALGSTYFHTGLNKIKILRGNGTWVTLN